MLPGINPRQMRQMQKMMKQMGMQELDVKEVILVFEDKKLKIEDPQVIKMNIMGQETYQITGQAVEYKEETEEELQGDIEIIMEQTGATKEEAEKALKETGDLAAAILRIQEKKGS